MKKLTKTPTLWIKCHHTKCIKEATKLYPQIIVVSVTKIGENTNNILNCYFFHFTLWPSNQLSTYRKTSLLINNIHLVLSFLEIQRRIT